MYPSDQRPKDANMLSVRPFCCMPIDVMQTAEDGLGDDLAAGVPRPNHCRIAGRALAKRPMRARHRSTQINFVETHKWSRHSVRADSAGAPKSHSLAALWKAFALAQCQVAASAARTLHHSGCRA
jgi:hypothetical protein